jgi:hemolysin activation/secretion protein
VNELRLYVFSDAAETSVNQPANEQRRTYGLSAVGLGLRARIADHLEATLENAFTLSSGATTKQGTDAVLFSVLGDF